MRRAWILLAVTLAAVAGVAVASARSDALTGNVWVLTTVRGKAPLKGTTVTATFTPAGNVSGSAGCNHYGGRFTVSGGTIKISSLASTLMGCPPKIAAQESAFLKALAAARAFHVGGGKLTLATAGGRTLLTFVAQARR